jgi:2-amino-4-hydroxy-6-hydroxymethyldihydropteridine diphosphokinase
LNLVVVGLGSNIDPKENIRTALRWIRELGEIRSQTNVLRTEPIGAPGQEWFMNCAVLLETELSPKELAVRLRDIEGSMGRPREGDRSGPRTIDLDVLVWNGRVVDENVYSRSFLGDAVRELSPEVGGPLDQASA